MSESAPESLPIAESASPVLTSGLPLPLPRAATCCLSAPVPR